MKKIPEQFSSHQTDLEAMQRATMAICDDVVAQVKKGVANGMVNESLLMSSLIALAHTSARAQEEYSEIRGDDESLPGTWTAVALS